MDRIPPNDEASVLLNVEAGDFTKSSILRFASKEAKGKIFQNSNEVPAKLTTNILGIGIFSFFLVGLPLVGYYFGETEGEINALREIREAQSTKKVPFKLSDNLADLGWENLDKYQKSNIFGEDTKNYFPVSMDIGYYEKEDHIVAIAFDIENRSEEMLIVDISLIAPDDDRAPRGFYQHFPRSVYDKIVFPKSIERVVLSGHILPERKEKIGFVEVNLKSNEVTLYNLKRRIDFSQLDAFPLTDETINKNGKK